MPLTAFLTRWQSRIPLNQSAWWDHDSPLMDWRLSCWLLCHQFLASCLRSNKHYRYLFHLGQEAKIKANFCTEARLQVFSCPTIMKVDSCSPPKAATQLFGRRLFNSESWSVWIHCFGPGAIKSLVPEQRTKMHFKHETNTSNIPKTCHKPKWHFQNLSKISWFSTFSTGAFATPLPKESQAPGPALVFRESSWATDLLHGPHGTFSPHRFHRPELPSRPALSLQLLCLGQTSVTACRCFKMLRDMARWLKTWYLGETQNSRHMGVHPAQIWHDRFWSEAISMQNQSKILLIDTSCSHSHSNPCSSDQFGWGKDWRNKVSGFKALTDGSI